MTRFKSAFAVPSGFAVATRAVAGAKTGTVQDTLVTGKPTTLASKRGRQVPRSTNADRAA